MTHEFQSDIDAVAGMASVPTILDVICRATGSRFAAVARVTESRWVACMTVDKLGLGLDSGSELEISKTFCQQIRATGELVVFDDAARDAAYANHPIPAFYGFQSYLSVPIVRTDGSFFGTLCALDPEPRKMNTPETLGMFQLFAELIAQHLDAGERVLRSEAALATERRDAELREQFIAVIGHDLRNPVTAIGSGARLLLRDPLPPKQAKIVRLMQTSTLRMSGMIDNLLDFARGRLGGGIPLDRRETDVKPVLEHVLQELESTTQHLIHTTFVFEDPIRCDALRISQLFANLLGNAILHGAQDVPITVHAWTEGGQFRLSVANGGTPIPESRIAAIFRPFERGTAGGSGLGLGLFIAAEIAKGHDGTIEATSTPEETRFTFSMPLG